MAGLDAKTVRVGQALQPLTKPAITKDTLKRYAAASGDPNPMHLDDEFARNSGYKGVFAHGMLSMGYLGEFLVQAAGHPSAIRRFKTRFAKLTWPGDVITCKGTVTAIQDDGAARVVDCDIWTENQEGEKKLVGTASLALPRG